MNKTYYGTYDATREPINWGSFKLGVGVVCCLVLLGFILGWLSFPKKPTFIISPIPDEINCETRLL